MFSHFRIQTEEEAPIVAGGGGLEDRDRKGRSIEHTITFRTNRNNNPMAMFGKIVTQTFSHNVKIFNMYLKI